MKITVNNEDYEINKWIYDKASEEAIFIIPTDDSISSIASVFDVKNLMIKVYNDDDVQIGFLYVHKISGIFEDKDENNDYSRIIELRLEASSANDSSTIELRTGIDDVTDAIIELAELINDIEVRCQNLSDRISALEPADEESENDG